MYVTAAGSLPGEDFRGALSAMADVLGEVLPLPELPDRGLASGMVGRAVGIIDGLGFDVQPAGWRLTSAPGADQLCARAQWRRDLDDAEELLQDFDGVLKVGIAGPWTLAAAVERPRGDRLLADHGARREVAQALAEGWAQLRADLQRRIPGAEVLLQVDEPALVAVADGAIPTASGFSTAALDTRLFRGAGEVDAVADWVHAGRHLAPGIVDTSAARSQSVDELVSEALRILRPLEIPAHEAAARVTLTTACGLASWPQGMISSQLDSLRRAAGLVAEAL